MAATAPRMRASGLWRVAPRLAVGAEGLATGGNELVVSAVLGVGLMVQEVEVTLVLLWYEVGAQVGIGDDAAALDDTAQLADAE